jgi:nucleotide-binding universal stress UspA family protein
MSWKPIVVGVDASPAAARAGALGCEFATFAHTSCHLIHAAETMASGDSAGDIEALYARKRDEIRHALRGYLPGHVLERLSIRAGHPAVALRQAAAEIDAGLIVVGGKHHTTLGEWAGRSTAMHLIRTAEIPVLLAVSAQLPRRVLVTLDQSAATGPTLEAAERFASQLGAQLKVMSVVEPLPTIGEVPPLDPQPYYRTSQHLIEKDIWPMITTPGVEKIISYGLASSTIVREAKAWDADLVVMGSHGKGWFERVLVGSVTARVVHELPTSLLIVPVYSALATGVAPSLTAAATV